MDDLKYQQNKLEEEYRKAEKDHTLDHSQLALMRAEIDRYRKDVVSLTNSQHELLRQQKVNTVRIEDHQEIDKKWLERNSRLIQKLQTAYSDVDSELS